MENNEGIKAVLETTMEKYKTIAGWDDVLDSKAGVLLGFEIALGVGYLTLDLNGLAGIKFWEGVIALILLAISAVLLLIVNWPKKYYIPLSSKFVVEKKYLEKNDHDILIKLIDDTQNAIQKNRGKLKYKGLLYKIGIILLLIAAVLLILSKLPGFYV